MITPDPRDIDMEYPIMDTPFYHWLEQHDVPYFELACRTYLHIGMRKPPSNMTGRDFNCMRCTHMHFYWMKAQRIYNENEQRIIPRTVV